MASRNDDDDDSRQIFRKSEKLLVKIDQQNITRGLPHRVRWVYNESSSALRCYITLRDLRNSNKLWVIFAFIGDFRQTLGTSSSERNAHVGSRRDI